MKLGIDLGGTKIEALLLDNQGNEHWRKRVPTPQGNYEQTLEVVADLVRQARTFAKDLGEAEPSIGMGTPGATSQITGLIKNANSTCLNARPLKRDLEALLSCSVRLANDANCMLVSEAEDGAARGAKSAFGVILGTGVGGALMIDGKLIEGHNSVAGEWGHNPLPWPQSNECPGPVCYCGRRSCLETWLSGPGWLARFQEQSASGSGSTMKSLTRIEQLLERRAQGDPVAIQSFEQYCDRLARGLASVINVFDPEVIVLAGGLSNIGAIYKEVPERWGDYIFSDAVNTRLVKSLHGDSSGVRGAAWLW